jgi:hypothetical protein
LEIKSVLKMVDKSFWYLNQPVSRYKIDLLSAESAFLFNMRFSACFESSGDCRLNFPIMTDVKVPFLDCDFKALPYAIPGKEIDEYVQYKFSLLCLMINVAW